LILLAAWTSVVEAVAIAVQALVVVIALLYAKRQLGEARKLREAQTRPFVVIDFDVFRIRPMIHLVIRNCGSTLARNVSFVFDPPLSSAIDEDHGTLTEARLLSEGMPTLAPGVEVPIFFDSFIDRGEDRPDAYQVSVTYEGEPGTRYEDKLLIDLGIYRNLHYIERKELHDVAKALEEIDKTLSRWNASSGGLHVRTDPDLRHEADERQRRFEEHRAATAARADSEGAPPPA
jgi:hypothetical protein